MAASCQITPPMAFNYSAVARDTFNNPLGNQSIGVQFSILQSTPSGTTVYQENHFVYTDQFGAFTLRIGTGAVQSGLFNNINWGNDKYFLQVGIDLAGGTNFLNMGTTQLLSVPYAMYAKSAGNVANGFIHFVGEQYGGGLVVNVYKDSTGAEHGLILALNNASDSAQWGFWAVSMPGTINNFNGRANTDTLIANGSLPGEAAYLCHNFNGGGYNDWYLPSIAEWTLVAGNMIGIERALATIPTATPLMQGFSQYSTYLFGYWTSNQYASDGNNSVLFQAPGYFSSPVAQWRLDPHAVRAMRAF